MALTTTGDTNNPSRHLFLEVPFSSYSPDYLPIQPHPPFLIRVLEKTVSYLLNWGKGRVCSPGTEGRGTVENGSYGRSPP